MYEAGDPHVDFAEVEEAFLEAVEKGQGVEDVEYMSDMMMPPVTYEDQGTGETVLRVSVTGVDYATGEPRGGRVTLYVLDEDGDMTLTGKEDRDLKTVSTFY